MKNTSIKIKVLTQVFLLQLSINVWAQQPLNSNVILDSSVVKYLSANGNISSVGLSLNIKTKDVIKLLMNDLKNPVANGETPQLGVLFHADEALTLEKLEHVLVTPAVAAYTTLQKVPSVVVDHVKVGVEAYACLFGPWNWGHCFRDVIQDIPRTIINEVQVVVPAVEAVYKDDWVPYIQINQRLVPIQGKFKYNVALAGLDAAFDSNKYNVNGVFDITVNTSLELALLGQNITPVGNFDVNFKIGVTNNGFVEIKNDGSVTATSQASTLKVIEAIGSSFVVDAIDFGTHRSMITDALMDLIGKEVDKKLNESIQRIISSGTSQFNIADKAKQLIAEFNKPLRLDNNGFLYPNVTAVFISQPNGNTPAGGENQIEIKVGVAFQPFATFESSPMPITLKKTPIEFGTQIPLQNGFNISAPIFLDYDFVSDQLVPLVTDVNNSIKDKFIIKKFIIDKPTAEFADQGEVKWDVVLKKRKNNKKIGDVHLNALFSVNRTDTAVCVKVSKVGVSTSNFWVFLGKGRIKKLIAKEAQDNSCDKFGKEVIKATHDLDEKLVVVTPLGTLKGRTEVLELTDILAYPKFILLKSNIAGSITVN